MQLVIKQQDGKSRHTGPRAPRLPGSKNNKDDSQSGGIYDLSMTTMAAEIMKKPTSKRGVGIVTSVRFPNETINKMPGVGTYDSDRSSLEMMASHHTSTKGTLSTVSKAKISDQQLTKNSCYYSPGPAVYDLNYAIGRMVKNDYAYALDKSVKFKKRDEINRKQLERLESEKGKNDIFTDKRACRRMAYLSLFFPQ